MPRFERALLGATFATFALAGQAHAHIDMVGDVIGRQGDQKMSPCDGTTPGTVYTFEPGATIKLQVRETIQHPSYYRIAFDDNGSDGFKEPATIDPIDPNRKCPNDGDGGQDQCTKGKGDYCNVVSSSGGASVLWDYLDPHLSGGETWTYTVTLPQAECENCVLQVIQVMEDDYIAGLPIHGPFCPQGNPKCDASASLEDIYHRCIDIKLKKGAGMTPGTVSVGPTEVKNNGILCPYAPGSDAGVPMSGADSGVVVIVGSGSDAGSVDHGSHGGGDGGVSGGTTGLPFDGSTPPTTPPTGSGATPGSSSDDSGCAVSPGRTGAEGAGFVALALAGLLAARRRRRVA